MMSNDSFASFYSLEHHQPRSNECNLFKLDGIVLMYWHKTVTNTLIFIEELPTWVYPNQGIIKHLNKNNRFRDVQPILLATVHRPSWMTRQCHYNNSLSDLPCRCSCDDSSPNVASNHHSASHFFHLDRSTCKDHSHQQEIWNQWRFHSFHRQSNLLKKIPTSQGNLVWNMFRVG